MDFTRQKYNELVFTLKDKGYQFITFNESVCQNHNDRFVILRHDVDLLPSHSLAIAKLECKLGAKSSYYFRAVPESWDEQIIKAIAAMGHEVGYHYESLTTCSGNIDDAYKDFKKNLTKLRELASTTTICMHGSPRSPYDSKDIWKKYDYHVLGINGEPYLDTDFNQVFYLTDTGRRWDGYKVSVRDKIEGHQERWNAEGLSFHTTDDILRALKEDKLPNQLMITTHPQRWNEFGYNWIRELIIQNIKNIIKAVIIRNR